MKTSPSLRANSRHCRGVIEALETRIAPATLLGVDATNRLVQFDADAPSSTLTLPILGLLFGEKVIGIDVRPANPEVYAITNFDHVYRVSLTTGNAQLLPGDLGLNVNLAGIDFDPVNDVARISTSGGTNVRLNIETGAIAGSDGLFHYPAGDINVGSTPRILGLAYDNNRPGVTSSTLYGIDTTQNTLVTINPTTGALSTVGSLGINVSDVTGFDIGPDGTAYLTSNPLLGLVSSLYTVNLTTGAASFVGGIGGIFGLLGFIQDIAVSPSAWTGLGNNGNWTNDDNWGGGTVPDDGTTIIFGQPGNQTSNNDFPAGSEFAGLIFTSSGNVVNGNPVVFTSGVTGLNTTGTNTVNLPIELGADQSISTAGASTLLINGDIEGAGHVLTISGAGRTELHGDLFDIAGVLKIDSGTGLLTGNNTYTGPTTIQGGILQIDGSQPNSNVVLENGILTGGGTIGGLDADAGTIDPGTLGTSGILSSAGNIDLGPDSTFSVDIFGLQPGSGYDQLDVVGEVFLAGELEVSVFIGLSGGETFTIINNDGTDPVTGTFAGLPQDATFTAGGRTFSIDYAGGDGNDVVIAVVTDNGNGGGGGDGGGNGGGGNGPGSFTIVDSLTATFIDVDGDRVTIKVSKGSLSLSDFVLVPAGNVGGAQLQVLNFSDDGLEFQGANIRITAKPTAAGGNGFVNIGYLNATGIDLGTVFIAGDLGQIDVGNAQRPAAAITSLTVQSLGALGTDTQPPGGSLTSNILGRIGSLTVRSDIHGATIDVDGDSVAANGRIGTLTIGGSLIGGDAPQSGSILTTGKIGTVTVGRNIEGGSGNQSGVIAADGAIGTLTVNRSIIGGSGADSGLVQSGGNITAATIGRDLIGSAGNRSGSIHSNGKIGTIIVRGGLLGGAGDASASIIADDGLRGTMNSIGAAIIGDQILGGGGFRSGSVFAANKITSITLAGTLTGGSGVDSGSLSAGGNMGTIRIAGDVKGGTAAYAGAIHTTADGRIGTVAIRGSLFAGTSDLNGIISDATLGTINIGGDVRGSEAAPARISAEGITGAVNPLQALAIRAVTVGGSLQRTDILAGYNTAGEATNPDVQIGVVTVKKDVHTSNISAGVDRGDDGLFGTDDDVLIGNGGTGVVSRIAGIVIKGQVFGTTNGSDHYGFVAERISALNIGKVLYKVTRGVDNFSLAPTDDVRAREDVQFIVT